MDEESIMLDEQEKPEDKKPVVSISKVEEFVTGLSDAQLSAVKATVDSVAERRTEPDVAHMSDNELREYTRKRYGFSNI